MISSAEKIVQRFKHWLKMARHHSGYVVLAILVGCNILVFLLYGAYRVAYSGKAFPGVFLTDQDVSGMNDVQIDGWLENKTGELASGEQKIELTFEGKSWELDLDEMAWNVDRLTSVYAVMDVGRRGAIHVQLSDQWEALTANKLVKPVVSWNEELLTNWVASIAAEINIPAIPPSVSKNLELGGIDDEEVIISLGQPGRLVDENQLITQVIDNLMRFRPPKHDIKPNIESFEVSEEQIAAARERALKLLGKELVIMFENSPDKTSLTWNLSDSDLIGFISLTNEWHQGKIADYAKTIAETIDRPPQDALFQFDTNNQKVVEFLPGKDGLVLDQETAVAAIIEGLISLAESEEVEPVLLSTSRVEPMVNNEEVNELGIKELLGRGESTFVGSIPSRVHNVNLAAIRINGVLVPPGETFSYNEALGDVSAATGFQTAYIIQNGRTVLGDGGGVCQDSTTLFRAVLDAGLPVVAWKNHSYRVGYYEQNSKPGFDATVFAPTTDFKFLNDTAAYILVQARVVGTGLTVELYGSDDGRVATISNYAMWDVAPPPPDLYQDDPTLPAGTVKQVDWKAWGAKTKFDYKVTRGEETLFEKTFYSIFKPWQSVFLRGTGGV